MAEVMKLKIYNKEDRLKVAQILIDNGYTVSQGKQKNTPTGRTLCYFLKVVDDSENADTAKCHGAGASPLDTTDTRRT